ncbi:MAG: hypothetical protein KC503_14035 [Myxococcales bacterium]|nr:hypothetical protein [Myxococcales bacterium]
MRGAATLVLAATLAVAASGCGPSCEKLAARYAEPIKRARARGPHARLSLPFALANRAIAAALAAQPGYPIPLPSGLGMVARALGKPRVRVAELRVAPAATGKHQLIFDATFELRDDRGRLLAARSRGQLAARVTRQAGKPAALEITLPPGQLDTITPQLEADAANKLAARLHGRLPALVRALVKQSQLRSLSESLVGSLSGEQLATLRKRLARLIGGRLISFDLPDVPLQAATMKIERARAAMVVDLTLALPVRFGLGGERLAGDRRSGGAARAQEALLRISGSALVELFNWGMRAGHFPARYDARGRPSKDGKYRPRFDWIARDERPLRMSLYRLSSPCALVRVQVAPRAEVKGDALSVKMDKRQIKAIEGGLWARLALLSDVLFSRAVKSSRERAAARRIRVGDREVELRVTRASFAHDELTLGFAVRVVGDGQARARRAALADSRRERRGESAARVGAPAWRAPHARGRGLSAGRRLAGLAGGAERRRSAEDERRLRTGRPRALGRCRAAR